MEMKMIRVLDLLSAIGALAMAATPLAAITTTAHAAQIDRPAVAISVGDLDFSRTADVTRFEARVNAAASTICQADGMTGLEQGSSCAPPCARKPCRSSTPVSAAMWRPSPNVALTSRPRSGSSPNV